LIGYARYASAGDHGYRRRLAWLTAIIGLVPLIAGCGVLGGLSNTRLGTPLSLTVSSPVFNAHSKIGLPNLYTCHGAGLRPPLQWSGAATQQAQSFAIVVDDSQAPITPYVYWIVFDLSKNTVAIGQNLLPTGARQAQNSEGKAGYQPPCPQGPKNDGHKYRFTVYALNTKIDLPNGESLSKVWQAIASHVIAAGRITVKAYP
jgi:Raf kinase inhibitor-like YbhB/YbcL family protein